MPGPVDCTADFTVSVAFAVLVVPQGTVCIQCSFNDVVATDSVFTVNDAAVDGGQGVTVEGVLVVFDSEELFNSVTSTTMQCVRAGNGESQQFTVFLGTVTKYIGLQ